jgi:hypothetical protein
MKKRFSVVAVAISILLGFTTLSFGQVPDISGDWLLDLSGAVQGGALITIDTAGDFQGYGLTLESGGTDGNGMLLSGHVDVDVKGKITGTYLVTNIEDKVTVLSEGSLTGKVDKKITKFSFKFEDGPNGKAIKLPADPDIPISWTATASHGKAVFDLTIAPLTYDVDLDMDLPHRMYSMNGLGNAEEGPVSITGGFFLNGKSMAYGWYEAYTDVINDPPDPISLLEEGLFFGKVNLKSGKSSFSFKLTGYDPDDGSMSRAVLKGMADE